MFLTDYEASFTKVCRNAVLQAAGDYEASAYWKNRTLVGDSMK